MRSAGGKCLIGLRCEKALRTMPHRYGQSDLPASAGEELLRYCAERSLRLDIGIKTQLADRCRKARRGEFLEEMAHQSDDDLTGSFCTKRIDRNWLGKEQKDAE